MNLYLTYESRNTLKSFTLFITVKAIAKLNLGHRSKFEIQFQKTSRRGSRPLDNTGLVIFTSIGSLSKPRRRRQRERHQTKGLMSKTIAVHVRYKSLYISLTSSAKQQREMAKFCVVYGTWTTTPNFSHFHFELKAFVAYLA